MPLADDGIRPVHTAVVRLRSYGKGDDAHTCKNKGPHLLVLTSDALQLFTTSDADAASDLGPAKSSTSIRASALSRLNLGKIGRIAELSERTQDSADDMSIGDAGDIEDLAEGQVFRLGVALTQILGLQLYKEDQLIVWYQPNKPSKKRIGEDQTMMVLRGFLGAVEAVAKWDSSALPATRPPAPMPGAHHFTIKLGDATEAQLVKENVEMAQRKLALAILWLSEGLPLEPESSLVMVTIGGRGGGAAHTLPLPTWDTELQLPFEASQSLASSNSRRALSTLISVYMATPLGVAVAEIPLMRIRQSAAEGGAPFGTIAVLQTPPEGDSKRPGKKWAVTLSWRARQGELLQQGSSVHGSEGSLVPVTATTAANSGKQARGSRSSSPSRNPAFSTSGGSAAASGPAGGGSSSGREVAMRTGGHSQAVGITITALVILSLAALVAHFHPAFPAFFSFKQGGMGLLIGLAALSGLAAGMRRVREQLARLRAPAPGMPGDTSSQCYQWYLTLLDVDIAEETLSQAPASPPVKRSISLAPAHPGLGPGLGPGQPIPHHILLLMENYPDIISADTARRFLIGLDSETKAFAALNSMAKWTSENKLNEILRRPQPAFTVMKRHYVHGFPGWSRKKDCLVEVECMGAWPAAYTAIAAEGVSEQAMLEHLLFTYQYAFGVLDPRPLPDGKTVKIVDLGGLGMSDLKTPGFKLITRVGAMLSLNFPQRLHQCFLINAPGWWAVAWKLISPLIPAKVRKQMQLFGKNDLENATKAMLEWVDDDVLPVKYGGKNILPLSECPFEIEMANSVAKLNSTETVL